MKNKSKELFVALAMETRLRFSEEHGALWGELQGYPVVVYVPNENYPNMFQAVFGGTLHGGTMDKQDTKELRKSVKGITRVEATATSVSVVCRDCRIDCKHNGKQLAAERLYTRLSALWEGCSNRGRECGGCLSVPM